MIKFISTQLNGSNNIVEVLNFVNNLQEIYFDYETTGLNVHINKPILLAVGNDNVQYVIDLRSIDATYIKKLFDDNKHKLWVAHAAKFEYKFTKVHYKVELRNLYCTMIASQVIYNGYEVSHSLKECMLRHFGIKLNKDERKSFEGMDDKKAFIDSQILYVAEDIAFLPRLKARQLEVCPDIELRNYLFEIEFPLIPCIGDTELNGVIINSKKWLDIYYENIKKVEEHKVLFKQLLSKLLSNSKLKTPFKKDTPKTKKNRVKIAYQQSIPFGGVDTTVKTYEKLVLEDLLISSSYQLKEVFKRLDLNFPDTNEATLQNYLLNTHDSPYEELINTLLVIRETEKLASTYGKEFLNAINPITKKLHTNYHQCKSDTLRIISTEPNLQNLPRLNSMRNCFEAESGYTFAIIDFDGQEVRLAASHSRDAVLLKSLNDGLDLHSYLAEPSYNIIYKEIGYIPNHGSFKSKSLQLNSDNTITVSKTINKGLRQEHKSLLFAKFYLAGANRFAQVLNIPKEVAYKVYNKLSSNLIGLDKYQKQLTTKVQKSLTVFANSIYKVRKYFHKVKLGTMEVYEMDKQSVNFPIQSSGAQQVKESWITIDRYFRDNNIYNKYPKTIIVLHIYDELVIQLPDEELDFLANKCKEIMEETGQRYLIPEIKCKAELTISKVWKK